MKFNELLIQAAGEIDTSNQRIEVKAFENWLIAKNRINDLIVAIQSDSIVTLPLRKKYCGNKFIKRLINADSFIGIASAMNFWGHKCEAESVFKGFVYNSIRYYSSQ
jgi:hypothetical protein